MLTLLRWIVIKFLKDRSILFLTDLIWLSDKLILVIVNMPEVVFESIDKPFSDYLKLLILIISILILIKSYQLSSKISERRNLLFL